MCDFKPIPLTDSDEKFFIKFCPFNINMISNLLEKKIWFSDVYSLNDYGEYPIFCNEFDGDKEKDNNNVCRFLEQCFSDCYFKYKVHSKILSNPFDRERSKVINALLNWPEKVDDPVLVSLLEYVVGCKIGVSCFAGEDILSDSRGAVMLSHYSDKLNGAFLAYKASDNSLLKKVNYRNDEKLGKAFCLNTGKSHSDHMSIDTTDLTVEFFHKAFLEKNEAWKYETEYRLFNTPGAASINNFGLDLTGVFYTNRIGKSGENLLMEINEKYYSNKLKMGVVMPSFQSQMLQLQGGMSVIKFLKGK